VKKKENVKSNPREKREKTEILFYLKQQGGEKSLAISGGLAPPNRAYTYRKTIIIIIGCFAGGGMLGGGIYPPPLRGGERGGGGGGGEDPPPLDEKRGGAGAPATDPPAPQARPSRCTTRRRARAHAGWVGGRGERPARTQDAKQIDKSQQDTKQIDKSQQDATQIDKSQQDATQIDKSQQDAKQIDKTQWEGILFLLEVVRERGEIS